MEPETSGECSSTHGLLATHFTRGSQEKTGGKQETGESLPPVADLEERKSSYGGWRKAQSFTQSPFP